jgi:hypothetical protein
VGGLTNATERPRGLVLVRPGRPGGRVARGLAWRDGGVGNRPRTGRSKGPRGLRCAGLFFDGTLCFTGWTFAHF